MNAILIGLALLTGADPLPPGLPFRKTYEYPVGDPPVGPGLPVPGVIPDPGAAPGTPPPGPVLPPARRFDPGLPPRVVPPPRVVVPPRPLLPERPLSHYEFAKAFQPVPGTHKVTLLHPRTCKPVSICFRLPPGCPRVEVNRRRIKYDYGKCEVEIIFRLFGRVAVDYDD